MKLAWSKLLSSKPFYKCSIVPLQAQAQLIRSSTILVLHTFRSLAFKRATDTKRWYENDFYLYLDFSNNKRPVLLVHYVLSKSDLKIWRSCHFCSRAPIILYYYITRSFWDFHCRDPSPKLEKDTLVQYDIFSSYEPYFLCLEQQVLRSLQQRSQKDLVIYTNQLLPIQKSLYMLILTGKDIVLY